MLICASAFSQSEWTNDFDKAQDLLEKGENEPAYLAAFASMEKYRLSGAPANDNYAAVLYLLATACHGTDRLEEGIDYATRAIQIRQQNAGEPLAITRVLLAQLYWASAKYQLAAAELEPAVSLLEGLRGKSDGGVVDAKFEWANALYFAGQREKALSVYGSVADSPVLDEEIILGFSYYGQLLMETGHAVEAITVLERVKIEASKAGLLQTESGALMLMTMGASRLSKSDWVGAEANYREVMAFATDQEKIDALAGLSEALIRQGKGSAALKYLRLIGNSNGAKTRAAALYSQLAGQLMETSEPDSVRKYLRLAIQTLDAGKKEHLITLSDVTRALGQFEQDNGRYQEAKDLFLQSLRVARESGNPSRICAGLNHMAGLLLLTNDDKAAQPLAEESIRLLRKNQVTEIDLILAFKNLGTLYHNKSAFVRSDSAFQAALSIASKTTGVSSATEASVRSQYASCLQQRGDLSAATAQINQARKVLTLGSINSSVQVARMTGNLASLQLLMGKTQTAQVQIDSAINKLEPLSVRFPVDYASLLLIQARIMLATGAYTKSEQAGVRVVRILKESNATDSDLLVLALDHQANVYKTLGNYTAAEPLLLQALNELEKSGRQGSVRNATVLQNLATLYQVQEKYDQAEKVLQLSMDLDLKSFGKTHPQYAVSLQNMAALRLKLGKRTEALQLLESARDIVSVTSGKESRTYGTLSANLATLYQDLGRYDDAEKEWLSCLGLRTNILGKDHPDYIRALYGTAGLYFAAGKFDKAGPYFDEAVSRSRSQVKEFFNAMSDRERTAFYQRVKPVFETYADFAFQAYSKSKDASLLDRIYDLQLSTKSILLSSSNRVRETILGSQDENLKSLYREWVRKKEELVHMYAAGKDGLSPSVGNVTLVQDQANALEKKLAMESAVFSNELSRKAPNWIEVRDALKPGEAAVEFIRVRRKYVKDSVYYLALVIRPGLGHPEAAVLPGGNTLENRWYPYYRNTTAHLLDDSASIDWFWRPVMSLLRDSKRVYVSCDGILNKVSLNGLYDRMSRSYVIDKYDLQMLGNTAELVRPNTLATSAVREAAVFGYPDFNLNGHRDAEMGSARTSGALLNGMRIPDLPATQAEVQLVSKLLSGSNWKVSGFADGQASEENLKKLASPAVLHIATHGFFQPDSPMEEQLESVGKEDVFSNPLFRSGLLLAGAGASSEGRTEDGLLTAYEAMNLDLSRTSMVCLSACETGLGEVMNGEGVYGLQRAFQVAGAQSLLMSLWQVDDEATQELMTTFYQGWVGGLSKNDAFRKAQKQVRDKYGNPYFWAAFVLLGK